MFAYHVDDFLRLCGQLFCFFLPSTIFLMKNSPALYELLTKGPEAVYRNPISLPIASHLANFSGVTYSTTLRCRLVGCIYCPKVRQSTFAFLRSFIVFSTSSSDSPNPSIMDDLVTNSPSIESFAICNTERVCRYLALGSRTKGVSRSIVSIL